jgi:O-antigen ligase
LVNGLTKGRAARLAVSSLLAGAMAVPTFSGGGFDASSRSLFIALAGGALLAAVVLDAGGAVRDARSPLALALAALAGLSLLSAAWTVGASAAALRWGLVIGAYAAVLVAAATVTSATGPWLIAGGIAVLAFIEAVVGLHAVASHTLPEAERLRGSWRPGGTFEYPPALALLEVGALPVFSCAMGQSRAPVAGAAAGATVLAGAVLGLADNRLAVALAAAVLLVLMLRPSARPQARAAAVGASVLGASGGLLAALVLGAHVGLALLAVAAGIAWPMVRRGLPLLPRGSLAAVALSTTVLAVAAVAAGSAPATDLLHGRGEQWRAAVQTWLDRPVFGAGADAYYVASIRHQRVDQSLFAHDLPLELGAELGLLGLLLGVALYFCAALSVARAWHATAILLLGPLVVAFLVSNLLDWTWHLAGLGSIWAAAAGALTGAVAPGRGEAQGRTRTKRNPAGPLSARKWRAK